jgi:hypothetical protein
VKETGVPADLEQLGPTGFQDLAGALLVASFGPGIQAMGSGRDGGRDLYHDGPLHWAPNGDDPGEAWEGYTVFQVKHKQRLEAQPADNAAWLSGQIRGELTRWADPESGRDPVPDSIAFITNVPLSAVAGSGGHDQTIKAIRAYIASLGDDGRDGKRDRDDIIKRKARYQRLSRIRHWRIWDGHQIQTLLKAHPGVRNAFPGFFTAADLFANMSELTGTLPTYRLEHGLRAHARTTLIGDGAIYFDDAGSGDGTGIPLHDVVIDLSITPADSTEPSSVIRYVLERGDTC